MVCFIVNFDFVQPNVELLTFMKMSVADTYLIRLHHVFAGKKHIFVIICLYLKYFCLFVCLFFFIVNEDSVLSGDASVDLSKLFNHLAPTRIDELSLTATVNASSVTRLQVARFLFVRSHAKKKPLWFESTMCFA